MLFSLRYRILLPTLTSLLIGILCFSLLFVTPVSAQGRGFMGKYSYNLTLEGIELEGEFTLYETYSNESLQTFFDTYNTHYIMHRPDYRLQSQDSGYIDIIDQYSYTNINGKLVKSETTYSFHLEGYQQVTVTTMYEYGYYHTITDNETLFEETYTEVYYEDGIYVESVDYHEYTFLLMEDDTNIYTEEVGGYECYVLDTYVFEGLYTDFGNPDDWDYYQGGPIVWVDIDNGVLVQQWQYDENNEIVAEINLLSLEEPSTPPPLFGGDIDLRLVIAGGGAIAIAVVGLVVIRSRRGRSEQPMDYYSEGSGYYDY
ncbi:MAG: hypothetical protein EAX87_01175 [Candidatus Thorarchaeota archaeon]|nr:hypothetical protein [Candidatus Thorarchaeota archaeon]